MSILYLKQVFMNGNSKKIWLKNSGQIILYYDKNQQLNYNKLISLWSA